MKNKLKLSILFISLLILSIVGMKQAEAVGKFEVATANTSVGLALYNGNQVLPYILANDATTNASTIRITVKNLSILWIGKDYNYTAYYQSVASNAIDCRAGRTWTLIGRNDSSTGNTNTSGNGTILWTVPSTDGYYCLNITATNATGADSNAVNFSVTARVLIDDTPPTVTNNWTASLYASSDTLYVWTDDAATSCFYGYKDSTTSTDFPNAFTTSAAVGVYKSFTNISGGELIYFKCRDDHYNWESGRHTVRTYGDDEDETNPGFEIRMNEIVQHNKQKVVAFIIILCLLGAVVVLLSSRKRKRR